jgi:nitrite reductase (NO-forming)
VVEPPPEGRLRWVALRVLLGAIWAVDATLKWLPAFRANYVALLTGAAQGQPGLLRPWFSFLMTVVSGGRAPIFAYGNAVVETYLALALLTGFARKVTYGVGAAYAFLVWATAEGFGGPYVPGTTTDVGAAIVYSVLFLAFLAFDASAGRSSLDGLLERVMPRWRLLAEVGSPRPAPPAPVVLQISGRRDRGRGPGEDPPPDHLTAS